VDCVQQLVLARVAKADQWEIAEARVLVVSTVSMGRTRPKTRKARPPVAPDPTESQREDKYEPTIKALLEKAQEMIVQCDYDLAGKFVERVLKRAPDNVEGKEILGVVQLETGLLGAAKQVRFTSYRNHVQRSAPAMHARHSYHYYRPVQEHRPRHHPLRIYISLS